MKPTERALLIAAEDYVELFEFKDGILQPLDPYQADAKIRTLLRMTTLAGAIINLVNLVNAEAEMPIRHAGLDPDISTLLDCAEDHLKFARAIETRGVHNATPEDRSKLREQIVEIASIVERITARLRGSKEPQDPPPPLSTPNESSDFRASCGEIVRRKDLDRAAGTGKFRGADPDVAGYEGVNLAKAALAGDQAALDAFHEIVGLALPGVTEYVERKVVRITELEIEDDLPGVEIQGAPVRQRGESRVVIEAVNEGGNNCTQVDAADLVAWILSPDGRAALKRRGIDVPSH
jgi:hypothetical protein